MKYKIKSWSPNFHREVCGLKFKNGEAETDSKKLAEKIKKTGDFAVEEEEE